ncbi:WecB/TagA/CpsF family glycosyltransferase [Dehalobacterium formicoaceticum]|uniref:WecB/TagA/CpsF family glycosyltransferase n=1 Tax=Dehalobacterium formicoaceticum TaxID=51515 RepID=A0ABT1Y6B6_9FIRM|nr:WecB/TagA/CpsF family glycosyltransferase [Dehalobacterium formicoaceticum]MCR6545231.1 WecB/TagA/CpsF family glycosyltransferase [Dehalobacterium formicoaceticum]
MESSDENMRYQIFNTYVDVYSFDETVHKIERIISERNPTQHVVINASKVNLMQKDRQLTEIVNSCPLINADGASIVWAAKKLDIPLKERVTGIDLFLKLVEISNDKGYRIFLFGAKEEVVAKVKRTFEEKYSNLKIAGIRNGYFNEAEEPEIVNMIAQSNSDILFVAFSSPKKEFWINKYLHQLKVPFVMGVGGSFDIVAGMTSRAPVWMQKKGLEWLYRFFQEPRRMWKRYIIGNAKYIILVYKTKYFRKKHKEVGQ